MQSLRSKAVQRGVKREINDLTQRVVYGNERLSPQENLFFKDACEAKLQAVITPPNKLNELKASRWLENGKMPLIVLVHGISSTSRQKLVAQMAGVSEELGLPTMRVDMPDSSERLYSIPEKAEFLSKAFEEALQHNPWIDANRIFLVGHSQGGLTIRRAFKNLRESIARRDAKAKPLVVTISTPPHLKHFNNALQNMMFYFFNDRPIPNGWLLPPREAEKDFLSSAKGVTQLHISSLGDPMLPAGWYGLYSNTKHVRLIPSMKEFARYNSGRTRYVGEKLREAFESIGFKPQPPGQGRHVVRTFFGDIPLDDAALALGSGDEVSQQMFNQSLHDAGLDGRYKPLTPKDVDLLIERGVIPESERELAMTLARGTITTLGEQRKVAPNQMALARKKAREAALEMMRAGKFSLSAKRDVNPLAIAVSPTLIDNNRMSKLLLEHGVEEPVHNWKIPVYQERLFKKLFNWVCGRALVKTQTQAR